MPLNISTSRSGNNRFGCQQRIDLALDVRSPGPWGAYMTYTLPQNILREQTWGCQAGGPEATLDSDGGAHLSYSYRQGRDNDIHQRKRLSQFLPATASN
jgi:hypothetical protein